MSGQTIALNEVELSNLIGEIYDSAIDPSRWDATLDKLRGVLNCSDCGLYDINLRAATTRMRTIVGLEAKWVARFVDYADAAAAMMASAPDLMSRALDEPLVGSRDIPEEVFLSNRYWQEWAMPQGHVDFITLNLIRDPGRVAGVALGRHDEHGLITPREVQLMRLFAPHLRRAVIISDLIELKSIEVEALGRTLDMVPSGVVLVAENSEILHANRTAGRMMDEATPVFSVGGKLSVSEPETARQLHRIVRMAAHNEAQIGSAGIGMALNSYSDLPATAHILPIATGALRSRLLPGGAVAVFVSSSNHQPATNLAPIAETFALSKAETRVLGRLMQGDSLPAVAATLGISRNTAKTHLSRLFSKTGTQRQAELIALVTKLVPPVAPPRGTEA